MALGNIIPQQTKPLCKYFGTCGGCSTQHVPYAVQLENKKQRIISALKKNNIPVPAQIHIHSGEPYFYRNRMDFLFTAKGLGLRMKVNPGAILPVDECVIANKKVNELLAEVQRWFLEHTQQLDLKTLAFVIIRAAEHTASSAIVFVLSESSTKHAAHTALIEQFAQHTTAENVILGFLSGSADNDVQDCYAVKGSLVMKERLCDVPITFSSFSFFQNNTQMAEQMIRHCAAFFVTQNIDKATLLDLYGGAGTFGLSFAHQFARTIIMDTKGPNIMCAEQAGKAMNLRNLHIVRADAKTLARHARTLGLHTLNQQLFVITDPPRIGMDQKAIKALLDLSPKAIIYISCNPMQMTKELKRFMKQYTLASLALFDLFPQTNHIEAIAVLQKK